MSKARRSIALVINGGGRAGGRGRRPLATVASRRPPPLRQAAASPLLWVSQSASAIESQQHRGTTDAAAAARRSCQFAPGLLLASRCQNRTWCELVREARHAPAVSYSHIPRPEGCAKSIYLKRHSQNFAPGPILAEFCQNRAWCEVFRMHGSTIGKRKLRFPSSKCHTKKSWSANRSSEKVRTLRFAATGRQKSAISMRNPRFAKAILRKTQTRASKPRANTIPYGHGKCEWRITISHSNA